MNRQADISVGDLVQVVAIHDQMEADACGLAIGAKGTVKRISEMTPKQYEVHFASEPFIGLFERQEIQPIRKAM